MSDSLQSQILDAVVARLTAAGQSAFRTRFTPFTLPELPASNVFPDDVGFEYEDTITIENKLRFMVRFTNAAVDGAEKAVDSMYVAGNKALMADRTIGGLARIVRILKATWDYEKGSPNACALVVTYEAEFSTTNADPSVAGL